MITDGGLCVTDGDGDYGTDEDCVIENLRLPGLGGGPALCDQSTSSCYDIGGGI